MRRIGVALVLLAGAFSVAAAPEEPFRENSDELLIGADRHQWQKPIQVMMLLSVRRAERVAEIGAGKGFFTQQFAVRVGSEGRIYAVESDPDLLEHLELLVNRFPDANGEVIRADATDLHLPGDLDMVFSTNTWHHVDDRAAKRKAVWQALKPGGRFVIIDWRTEEIPIGPPVDHRLARKTLIEEMKADGWTLSTDARVLKYQYFLIFTRPN